MRNEEKSKKIFNRILTIVLMIFIAVLIIVNFICSNNHFIITVEIIICIAFLVVLCLSETFDNLSIPKLLDLKKNLNDVKKENSELKDTNIKLIQHISNNNANSQTTYLPGAIKVVGSPKIEDLKLNNNDECENSIDDSEVSSNEKRREISKRQEEMLKYRQNLRIVLLKKALNDINDVDIQYNIKATNSKAFEDNIIKSEIRFDSLKISGKNHIFYEVKYLPIFMDFDSKLYRKLKLVESYGEFYKCNSKLALILPILDNELSQIIDQNHRLKDIKNKIYDTFSPAMENGLLEVIEFEISKEDLDNYIKDKKAD